MIYGLVRTSLNIQVRHKHFTVGDTFFMLLLCNSVLQRIFSNAENNSDTIKWDPMRLLSG